MRLVKNGLLELIEQTDDIRSYFHILGGNGMLETNVIYDRTEFLIWRQELLLELQGVYDRTKDHFIHDTIENLKHGFSGWEDEYSFDVLRGNLLAIEKNIEKYYPTESEEIGEEGVAMERKQSKIFISHSSRDKGYVTYFTDLLEYIGLKKEQLFCSSVPGYGIPLGEDIYDYLKQQFKIYDLYVIFILSTNYYESIACMNEMGAAWVLQNKYTIILLPEFEFCEIKGAINPRRIALSFNDDKIEIKEKLNQLKDALVQEFKLDLVSNIRWEEKRDDFIATVLQFDLPLTAISPYALNLLQAACEAEDETILRCRTLSGMYIQVDGQDFITSQEQRKIAKWEGYLEELLDNSLIKAQDPRGNIFVVTKKGYDLIKGEDK